MAVLLLWSFIGMRIRIHRKAFNTKTVQGHTSVVFFLLLLLFMLPACRHPQPVVTVVEQTPITCGQATPELYHYKASMVIAMEDDSAKPVLYPKGKVSFWLITDSLKQPLPLEKYLTDNLRYPELLKESGIQGRWFYQLEWNHHQLQNWKPLRTPESGQFFHQEVDRVLQKVQRDIRFYRKDTASWMMDVRVEVERVKY